MSAVGRWVRADPLGVVDAGTSIQAAAVFMRSAELRAVLVVDRGELVGVLSEEAIIVGALTADRHPADIPAGEWCERDCPLVSFDDPIDRAVELMRDQGLGHVAVVHHGRLMGTVSLSELTSTTPAD